MLVATTQHNEQFIITEHTSRAELQQVKEQMAFYCPQCKYQVALKVGKIRIPHFAHVRTTACEHLFSERESAVHLLGKQQLFSFFQSKSVDVQLESMIRALQQRPDLLVVHNNEQFAIEFQCSRLPYETYLARTQGYLSKDIQPIWILKTPEAASKKGVCKLSLNAFEELFIRTYKERAYVLTYNPYQKQFVYINHLWHVMNKTYIASLEVLPLQQQTFPFFVPNVMSEQQFELYMQLYGQLRQNFLSNRLRFSQRGVQDLFLRGIYEMRLLREQLPLFIGLPVSKHTALPLCATEWQLLLFYFLHVHQITLLHFEHHHIAHFLTWAKIACTDEMIAAVASYVRLLRELHIEHPHMSIPTDIIFALLYRECIAIS